MNRQINDSDYESESFLTVEVKMRPRHAHSVEDFPLIVRMISYERLALKKVNDIRELRCEDDPVKIYNAIRRLTRYFSGAK